MCRGGWAAARSVAGSRAPPLQHQPASQLRRTLTRLQLCRPPNHPHTRQDESDLEEQPPYERLAAEVGLPVPRVVQYLRLARMAGGQGAGPYGAPPRDRPAEAHATGGSQKVRARGRRLSERRRERA